MTSGMLSTLIWSLWGLFFSTECVEPKGLSLTQGSTSGGIAIPGSFQKGCACDTWEYDSVVNTSQPFLFSFLFFVSFLSPRDKFWPLGWVPVCSQQAPL